MKSTSGPSGVGSEKTDSSVIKESVFLRCHIVFHPKEYQKGSRRLCTPFLSNDVLHENQKRLTREALTSHGKTHSHCLTWSLHPHFTGAKEAGFFLLCSVSVWETEAKNRMQTYAYAFMPYDKNRNPHILICINCLSKTSRLFVKFKCDYFFLWFDVENTSCS